MVGVLTLPRHVNVIEQKVSLHSCLHILIGILCHKPSESVDIAKPQHEEHMASHSAQSRVETYHRLDQASAFWILELIKNSDCIIFWLSWLIHDGQKKILRS